MNSMLNPCLYPEMAAKCSANLSQQFGSKQQIFYCSVGLYNKNKELRLIFSCTLPVLSVSPWTRTHYQGISHFNISLFGRPASYLGAVCLICIRSSAPFDPSHCAFLWKLSCLESAPSPAPANALVPLTHKFGFTTILGISAHQMQSQLGDWSNYLVL